MSLISWYKLDGSTTNTVSGVNGTTPYGSAAWVSGKIAQCAEFANTGTGVIFGEPCNITENFTCSFWAKKNGTTSGDYHGLVNTYYNSATPTGFGMFLRDGFDSLVYIDTADGATRNYYSLTVPVVVTKWNHYCLRYKDGYVSFYFNGSLIDRRQLTIIIDVTKYLCIGKWAQNYSGYYLNGDIDDIKVYDHALSSKEIKELSRAKILHYKFDDFQEPTTNLVPTSTITSYAPYHTITRTGTSISMTALSEYSTGVVAITMQMASLLPLYQKSLSFSGYLKKNGLPISFNGTKISSGYQNSGRFYFDLTSGYFEVTQYYENNSGNPWFIGAFVNAVVGDVITIDNFQIEEKYHNTPYTDSSRTASLVDCSGYGNNTTIIDPNSPAWESDGKIGRGKYKFYKDSGKDYITLASNDVINTKRTVSISLWFKINGWVGAYTTIFGKTDDTSTTPSRTYTIFIQNDGAILASIADTAATINYILGASGGVVVGNWYHFVLTIDRDNGTMNGYLNGVAYANTTITLLDNITHSYPLNIGERTTTFSSTNADIDDVRMYAIPLSSADVLDIYKSRGSIDADGNLHLSSLVETNHKPLLLDYTSWQDGQTGSVGVFTQNGTTAENRRLLGRDPWNKETVLWESGADIGSDADGGWNSGYITVGLMETYRFSCWIKRSVIGNGKVYLGFLSDVSPIDLTTGLPNSNPYFLYYADCTTTDWLLYVGHVMPVGYTGSMHVDSGVYKVDGTKTSINGDFAFGTGTTVVLHRAYLYYSTDLTTRQQFVYPRVDLCDGNEPTIAELLEGHDSRNVDLIRSIGYTNPINMHVGPITHINTISELGPTESLLAYYPLDGDINDYSGNGFDGVTNTGALIGSGLNNKKCYVFDGVDDTIRCSNIAPSVNPVNNTWSSWCYPHTHTRSFSMIYGNYLPYAGMMGDGTFRFSAKISGTQKSINTGVYTDNAWYHLVFAYDGVNIKAYVNGSLVSTLSWPGTMVIDSGAVLSIGHWSNITAPDIFFFDGKIQDVRVYNKTLSAEEVMILYQITNPITTKLKINKHRLYLGGKIKETF